MIISLSLTECSQLIKEFVFTAAAAAGGGLCFHNPTPSKPMQVYSKALGKCAPLFSAVVSVVVVTPKPLYAKKLELSQRDHSHMTPLESFLDSPNIEA